MFDEDWEAESFLAKNPDVEILELCNHCGDSEHAPNCPHAC